MFESIRQYLQDWSDACAYAAECWPDTPFLHLNQLRIGEPYTALISIAIGCAIVWAVNERALAKIRRAPAAAPRQRDDLNALLGQMKPGASVNKLAA